MNSLKFRIPVIFGEFSFPVGRFSCSSLHVVCSVIGPDRKIFAVWSSVFPCYPAIFRSCNDIFNEYRGRRQVNGIHLQRFPWTRKTKKERFPTRRTTSVSIPIRVHVQIEIVNCAPACILSTEMKFKEIPLSKKFAIPIIS